MPPPVNMQIEEEFNAHPPWDAAHASRASRVLWESPSCRGTNACAAGILDGFKAIIDDAGEEVMQWWKQVGKGYRLFRESDLGEELVQTIKENRTLCKEIGYGITGISYFSPSGRLAKILGAAVGFGTTFAC